MTGSPDILTACPVRAVTLRLALPGLFSMALSGLGALAEALLLSGTPLAPAVSTGYPLLLLFQTIGFTLGTGAGNAVSRALGRSDCRSAQLAASLASPAALLAALAFSAFFLLCPGCFAALLGLSSESLAACRPYLLALVVSGPILCLQLVLGSLLRAQGRTKARALACIPGALLPPVLLALNRRFAALCILLREGLTLFLTLLVFLRDRTLLRPRLRALSFRPAAWALLLPSGLPVLLRQGAACLCALMLNRTCARFGPSILVGMGLAVRASALVAACVIGFGQGMQPVCGMNFGAGRPDRCREAYSFCQKAAFFALLPAGLVFFAGAGPLLRLFGAEEAAVQFGAACLRAQSLVFFAQGAVVLMTVLAQATGRTLRASCISVSRQLFFLPLLVLLPRFFGERALIFCQSAADLPALLLSHFLTRKLFAGAPEKSS